MPYIDPKTIEQVREIDLHTYLRDNEPDELVKLTHSTYCTRTHDSLKISNGKWYWWSRGFGGKSALDYLVKVRDMRFLEAVELLMCRNCIPLPPPQRTKPEAPKKKPFRLPQKSADDTTAMDYLRLRGIDPYVIRDCQRRGIIYENRSRGKSNVVFLGLDSHGTPRYAALRGCIGDFKGEAPGSDKRHPFKMASCSKNPEVHVFESAIDALSFATLLLQDDRDWRKENLLSLGGIPPVSAKPDRKSIPQAIVQYLADNPYTKTIRLHFDNDEPGILAADAIATALYHRCRVFIEPPDVGKDMNDFLLAKRETFESEHVELDEKRMSREGRKIRYKIEGV